MRLKTWFLLQLFGGLDMRYDDWLEIDTGTNKRPFFYPRYDAAPV